MQEGVENKDQINQSQFFDLITNDEVSWQAIIYDLIKTEQLNPWDINLHILAEKYILIIEQMEEADFFVSSKVLLACSLLLRLKSEILINQDIPSLNEILSGVKQEYKREYERIEIDESELPILVPKTPMSRHRKVTLDELMSALNQAIETENRRIVREVKVRQAKKQTSMVLPKSDHIPLKERIRIIYSNVRGFLKHPSKIKMDFSELAPSKKEKLSCFLPILHLSNDKKLFLYQEQHFEEIKLHLKRNEIELEILQKEIIESETTSQ